MTIDLQCPVCGAADALVSEREPMSYTAPFGPTRTLSFEVQSCRVCGESGDFAGTASSVIKKAVEEADRASVEAMLDFLGKQGISMAYLDRVLGLPARTVFRWKSGNISASGLALIRLVRRFPWLLEVAEAGYDEAVADRAVFQAAGDIIVKGSVAAKRQQPVYSVAAPREEVAEFAAREAGSARGTPHAGARQDDTEDLRYATA